MKIVILAQEDGFAIPTNILRLTQVPGVEILCVVSLDVKGALVNRKAMFVRGFGVFQAAKMAATLVWIRLLDRWDRLTAGRSLATPRSLRGAAMRCGADWWIAQDPNAEPFLDDLRALKPDVLVSFSAPCVFKPSLLAVPRLGCINLHCSLLPQFAGLLPSFWVLYHGAKETGATVHYMDDKIDNGAILGQTRISLSPGASMFEVIHQTKWAGGKLMAEVVRQLGEGAASPRPNPVGEGSYFSWPSVEHMREFRQRGGRLI